MKLGIANLGPPTCRDQKKLLIGKLRDHHVVAVDSLHRPAVETISDLARWGGLPPYLSHWTASAELLSLARRPSYARDLMHRLIAHFQRIAAKK